MKSFAQWRQEHEKEITEIERESSERIKETNMRLDVELAMIDASARMQLDEMLVGKSDEYRHGFEDGRLFERGVTQAILKA